MTSATTKDAHGITPPPPAEIKYVGQYSVNPLGEVSWRNLCAQLPAVLRSITTIPGPSIAEPCSCSCSCSCSWPCQVITGVAAAVLLTATAKAMRPVLGGDAVAGRLHAALPALLVVAGARALTRGSGAVAMYAERRIPPLPFLWPRNGAPGPGSGMTAPPVGRHLAVNTVTPGFRRSPPGGEPWLPSPS